MAEPATATPAARSSGRIPWLLPRSPPLGDRNTARGTTTIIVPIFLRPSILLPLISAGRHNCSRFHETLAIRGAPTPDLLFERGSVSYLDEHQAAVNVTVELSFVVSRERSPLTMLSS